MKTYKPYPLAEDLVERLRQGGRPVAQNPCLEWPRDVFAASGYVGRGLAYEWTPLPKVRNITDPKAMLEMSYALGLISAVRESFYAFYLNGKNKCLSHFLVAAGAIMEIKIFVNQVLGPAVSFNAQGLLVCHNHPSGSTKFSRDDVGLTRSIIVASIFLKIPLIDHLVIGKIEGFNTEKESFAYSSMRNEHPQLPWPT
jgi:DNA repair protein RadC